MKKLFVVLIAIAFYGCSSVNEVPAVESFSGFDFTSYSEKGFLFSPFEYQKDFESVGMIGLTLHPHIIVRAASVGSKDIDLNKYSRSLIHGYIYHIQRLDTQEVLDKLYQKAVSMGADALVNFKFVPIPLVHGNVNYTGFEFFGFAIKRK